MKLEYQPGPGSKVQAAVNAVGAIGQMGASLRKSQVVPVADIKRTLSNQQPNSPPLPQHSLPAGTAENWGASAIATPSMGGGDNQHQAMPAVPLELQKPATEAKAEHEKAGIMQADPGQLRTWPPTRVRVR